MFYEILRPYELSLWTLQDSFITVLKPIGSFNRGQIETPKCRIKNDGTQELNFSIPMYYREEGILVENPIWFNVINGSLIVNLRKLKLIFNKGEEGEEIIEFVINNVIETHTDGQLRCEVTAEGLAFQELGKVGYKISLTSQDFIDEYNEWYSKTVGTGEGYDYSSEGTKELDKPINNINYWCEKIFANSYWDYEIQMDWSSFDGIIVDDISGSYKVPDEEGNEKEIVYNGTYQKAPKEIQEAFNKIRGEKALRRLDRIYEEEYISSWEHVGPEEDGKLVPSNMEAFSEKLRLVDLEKSNFYNLTQNLAETFGIFCKYKYIHDANYHIIGKKCIFYNNFLSEQEGKIDITYPYSTSKIEREINSADIVTKMFVTPIEEESSPSGLVTIASVPANKSREDYILNFDYLYNIGTISQEQYNSIADYERTMYSVNTGLEPLSAQIAKLQRDLTDYEAKLTLAKEGQILAKEKMKNASDMIAAIMGDSTRLYRNLDNPYKKLLTATGQSDLGQLYSFSFSLQGIVPNDHPDLKTLYGYPLHEGDDKNVYGIKLWYKDEVTSSDYISYEDFLKKKFKKSDGSVDEEKVSKNNFKINLDGDNNVVSLSNIFLADDSVDNFYYATFSYLPQLQYQNIYDTYAKKLATEEAVEKEAAEKIKESEDKLKKIKEKYNLLLQKKQVKTAEFENMMGPALKEGSWQADNYSDYGSKYSGSVGYQSSTTEHVSFIWDTLSFEEEQLLYETTTINEEQVFYPCIDLTYELSTGETLLSKIKNNLDNLSFIYDITVTTDEGQEKILSTVQLTIGSKMQFAFIKKSDSVIKPVLLITDNTFELSEAIKEKGRFGIISSSLTSDGVEVTEKEIAKNFSSAWITNNASTVQVFPRLKFNTLLLKVSEDELIIKYNSQVLKNYEDYSILVREENYYATLKNKIMLQNGNINKIFDVAYSISNAALSLYLDALEVSKTNAFPQVSYTLEVSAMNKDFIKYAYQNLNKIVNINDSDLKFENIQGYISELELDLNNPWQDSITVQNYKTKFEDLFSTIVASTEQMKVNSFAYNNAASAFGPGGTLKPSNIQNTINQVDLTYAFQNGNLTIDEMNGIWARSDAGVVAIRGGGIFCATQTDGDGNWLWNTGIMPSGINANLITAGQIDTNLIKIYAGDNLRLQLNADGLFAYKYDSLGQADSNRYIVHNSEGLFSTIIKENGDKINLVEVSWDGFKLRKPDGSRVFDADMEGNLSITGTITANDGHIGPWLIKETGLWSEDGSAGITIKGKPDLYESPSLNGEDKMIWVTGTKKEDGTCNEFLVTADGTLYCSDIIAKGTISADSFIGNTRGEEIDQQLRNISIGILDGTTFSFDNKNYDGNLIISPDQLKFRIYTNALTEQELIAPGAASVRDDYHFYYGIGKTEETAKWKEIEYNEEIENYPSYLIWEPNYLTFRIKSDIMYLGLEEPFKKPQPQSLIYFKVEKKGKQRKVDIKGDPNYSEHTYFSIIQLTAETFGLGKYITPINPPSFTFIEDINNQKYYEKTKTFSVELTGFDFSEIYEKAYWRIEGEEKEYHYSIKGSGINYSRIKSGSSSLISDSEIIINEEIIESTDTINGNFSDEDDKLIIDIIEEGDKIFALATIGYDKVPEGGNIALTFCLDSAIRQTICFRIRNGSDGMNIILRSSSGSTLAKGDTETELSLQVYYGQQQINTDDSTKDFFYVWKKDGVALSSFFEKVIVQKENEEGELVFQEELREIVRPDIFNRKKIIVKASDFNLKSDYSCYVYTSLENKVGDLEVNSAIEDYKQKNENEEVDLTSSAIPLFIIKQPEKHAVMEGEQWSTTVITKGYNLKYQWYYKDKEMDAFEASDIKTNVYSTLLTKESIGRVIYCTITGTNLEGTNSYSINTNEILLTAMG